MGKPSEKEEEYFARQAVERMRKQAEDRQARMAEEEKRKLKELHYMHCPKGSSFQRSTTKASRSIAACTVRASGSTQGSWIRSLTKRGCSAGLRSYSNNRLSLRAERSNLEFCQRSVLRLLRCCRSSQ
jgi:hypothetical protein